MNDKIGSFEAISLILIITLNHIILSFSKNIIEKTSSASIINIIYITIITLIFISFIIKVLEKFPGLNIIQISEYAGGKLLKNVTGFIFFIYILFITSLTLRSLCENLKIIYFQNYPIIFLIVLFILIIYLCNIIGFKSIIRSNIIIIPLLMFSIVFSFIANMSNYDFTRIFPILGNGIFTTFFSGLSNLFALNSIIIIYFLPPFLPNNKEIKKISYTSIIISSILLILSTASVLFLISYVNDIEEFIPLYLVVRFIDFGTFFQRIDAIFLLIWILSMISYLSITFALLSIIFKDLTNIKDSKMVIGNLGSLILGLSLIPKNLVQIKFLDNSIYTYSSIILIFVFSFFIFLFAKIKKERENLNE